MARGIDVAGKAFKGIYGLREDNQARFVVSVGVVDVFVEQTGKKAQLEGVHLGVKVIFIPTTAEVINDCFIVKQGLQIIFVEIFCFEFQIVSSLLCNLCIQDGDGLFQAACFFNFLVYIYVRAHVHGIRRQHINHVLGVVLEVMQGFLEGRKAAFKALDQHNTHNVGELLGDTVYSESLELVFFLILGRLEEGYGTIAIEPDVGVGIWDGVFFLDNCCDCV